MIQALSGWLERIILLVLIATMLEMILPNTAMQRYVKLVMGLLILLAMLTPLMYVFQKDFSPERMAVKIMDMNSTEPNEDLNKIKEYGEKLMRQNSQDTQVYVQKQLESVMKAKVEETFGVTVRSVQVSFAQKEMDKEQAYPVISAVHIILDKDTKATKNGEKTKTNEIAPIEPVTIRVVGEAPSTAPTVSPADAIPPEQRKLLTEITHYVAQNWSIDQTQVKANLERETRGDRG